jgi:alkylated DNA repair protein (DNA oxidative demethylase)
MTEQGDLFADCRVPLPEMALATETVTPAQEAQLIRQIDACPLEPFRFGQWRGKRLTCNFGSSYDYARGSVEPAPPLPDWLVDLRAEVIPQLGRDPAQFVQALVIRYDSGAGIGWHRDRPQYGEVVGLSLGAPAVMRLRQRREGGFARCNFDLGPRAAYLLAGEARAQWEHSIVPMEATRWSVTFRTLR